MSDESIQTFLPQLLDERDWSLRELSRRTEKDGNVISHQALSNVLTGQLAPTKELIEIVARALRIPPSRFPEHRLEVKRERLNWRRVGVARALRELEE